MRKLSRFLAPLAAIYLGIGLFYGEYSAVRDHGASGLFWGQDNPVIYSLLWPVLLSTATNPESSGSAQTSTGGPPAQPVPSKPGPKQKNTASDFSDPKHMFGRDWGSAPDFQAECMVSPVLSGVESCMFAPPVTGAFFGATPIRVSGAYFKNELSTIQLQFLGSDRTAVLHEMKEVFNHPIPLNDQGFISPGDITWVVETYPGLTLVQFGPSSALKAKANQLGISGVP